MDRRLPCLRRQVVQFLARLTIVFERCIEMSPPRLLLDPRKKGAQRLRDASHDSQVDVATASQLLHPDIDLHDARLLRIELLVREVSPQHQQRLAVHHGAVAGRKPQQPGHTHVVRIVVLNKLLASQCGHNRSLELTGQLYQLFMSSRAAGPGQDRCLLGAVQLRRQVVEFRPMGSDLRPRVAEDNPPALFFNFGKRNIARYHDH
jgi:hypothetical protein